MLVNVFVGRSPHDFAPQKTGKQQRLSGRAGRWRNTMANKVKRGGNMIQHGIKNIRRQALAWVSAGVLGAMAAMASFSDTRAPSKQDTSRNGSKIPECSHPARPISAAAEARRRYLVNAIGNPLVLKHIQLSPYDASKP